MLLVLDWSTFNHITVVIIIIVNIILLIWEFFTSALADGFP